MIGTGHIKKHQARSLISLPLESYHLILNMETFVSTSQNGCEIYSRDFVDLHRSCSSLGPVVPRRGCRLPESWHVWRETQPVLKQTKFHDAQCPQTLKAVPYSISATAPALQVQYDIVSRSRREQGDHAQTRILGGDAHPVRDAVRTRRQ